MRFIHISDLHIGKRVGGFSMLEDQAFILEKIFGIIKKEKPDFVIIAGDIYDKLTPPAEAVALLDSFISRLAERRIETFIISGNHDSAERVAFGASIMNKGRIHFSPVYNGNAAKFTVKDEFGEADIYLLPYLRPAEVRRFFPEADISTTEDAVRTAVEAMDIDTSRRNIIVSHQFVAGGTTCDSERNSVGGTDSVPAEVYSKFDYAALGHLHGAQFIGGKNIRYSGTPLKYSFSEAGQTKSVTICTLREKGTPVEIETRELVPMRDMRIVKGSFDELLSGSSEDYISIVLTDIVRIPDAQIKLRAKYPGLMELKYEHEAMREDMVINDIPADISNSPYELFAEFFSSANGKDMTEEQSSYMHKLVNEIWGE